MGKKPSSSQPSQADPMSPTLEPPRMDPPPPYDTINRSSTSSSVRSVDHLDPNNTGPTQIQHDQTPNTNTTRSGNTMSGRNDAMGTAPGSQGNSKYENSGGCMNYGDNVNGCMNYGAGSDGCMNYYSSEGCMNYKSKGGCMNYRSTGGCLNTDVRDDWEGNEGCLNYRRGGGCCLFG